MRKKPKESAYDECPACKCEGVDLAQACKRKRCPLRKFAGMSRDEQRTELTRRWHEAHQ